MSGISHLPAAIETIPEGLTFWAERTPASPAIRSIDGRQLAHGELCGAVDRIAGRLAALGLGNKARVAVSLHGGIETCAALLGIMTLGAVVPFNPLATGRELARDLGRLRLDLMVTDGAVDEPPALEAAKIGVPTIAIADLLSGDGGPEGRRQPTSPPRPDSVAAILHTSGTTGLPKRVPRDHRSFVAAARAARQTSGLAPDDVAFVVSGVHTNAGLSNMLFALLSGGSCVLAPTFDPALVPDWVAAQRPTWALLNASELNLILDAAAAVGRPPLAGPESRLRLIRAGAQPMTPGTAERAEAFFGAPVFEGYGMSEASNIAKCGPGVEDRRPGSCGRPVAGTVEVRMLDDADRDVAPGMVGSIVVRGPTVFSGYLDDPETNAAAFMPGGWFRTGDLGRCDEEGFLYLKGRAGELINRGGEMIAPAEVEEVLQRHPAVAEGAVFAVPDPRLGEDMVAAVVLRPGMAASARELRTWLLASLAPSRAPRRIWRVEGLPRTGSGKVQRRELARMWGEARP